MMGFPRESRPDLLASAMEHVGFAIWQVQALEDTAAHYLVIRVHGHKGMGREKGHALLEAAHGRTLGALARSLKEAGVLEDDVATRLSTAVNERNWFAHRGRRETRGMFNKPELYQSLIRRAENLADESLALNRLLSERLVAFVKASGVDQAKLEQEADRLAAAWGIRD